MDESHAQRVLFVGWSLGSWDVITPLLDADELPNLASVIDRGVMGRLTTREPMLAPMAWSDPLERALQECQDVLGDTQ